MEIADLKKFLVIARHQNLQKAALSLDITPSALSKSLKRLETSLEVKLFDRVGKTLRLNEQGEKLQPRAIALTDLAADTHQALRANKMPLVCKVAAPSILQFKWACVLGRQAGKQSQMLLEFDTEYEAEALQKLVNGEVQLAIVTGEVLSHLPDGIKSIELGDIQMQVAMGHSHPLAMSTNASVEDVVAHPFAVPNTSPFCGEQRGVGCDGWQLRHLTRHVQWVVNDYALLSQLVKGGQALAFLPDFMIREWQLKTVNVTSGDLSYKERVFLLAQQGCLPWVNELINKVLGKD